MNRTRERDIYEVARRRMVSEQLVAGGIREVKVLEAMGRVPRHEFVGRGLADQAYLDRPLPIGEGQTISQPLMVALMTEALSITPTARLLEIGTGSGYQAAVLAELAQHVYTIERLRTLSIHARKVLYRLRYRNVTFRIGDGSLGWPEETPFDGIVVTAGSPSIPMQLQDQLADGGRLVIPVGGGELQDLLLIERRGKYFERRTLTGCRFVKLIGKEGWEENHAKSIRR